MAACSPPNADQPVRVFFSLSLVLTGGPARSPSPLGIISNPPPENHAALASNCQNVKHGPRRFPREPALYHAMEPNIDVAKFKQFEHAGWEQSVSAYDLLISPLTRQLIPPLFQALNLHPCDRLLDVATGPGYLAAQAHKLGCSVSAIDLSERMIAQARQVLPAEITLHVGDAEYLPFPGAEFDVITMNFGILHCAQPDRAVTEAFKALKIGGRFGFTIWAPPAHSLGFALVLAAIETYGSPAVKLPPGPPFFRFGDQAQGLDLLTRAGFSHPRAELIPLLWKLPNPESLFIAFYEGTARTGGLLRAQPPENLDQIRQAVTAAAARHAHGGTVELPMAAWVYTGEKSPPEP